MANITAKQEIKKIGIFTKDEHAQHFIKERFSSINNKIYRYCKLNEYNTYELDNLLKQQIYLSHPEHFNDPFDCNFGLHIVGIIESMINHYFKLMKMSDIEEQINSTHDFAIVVSDPFYGEVKRVLKEIAISGIDKTQLSESDLYKMVFTDKMVIHTLLEKILKVATNRYQRRHIEIPQKMIDLIIDFIRNNDVNQLIIYDDDSLRFREERSMYQLSKYIHDWTHKEYKKKQELNYYRRKLDKIINLTLRKRFVDKIGVACFTESLYEPLMWSHYASSYQGFLLEYDLSKITSKDLMQLGLFLPVNYTNQRPLIDKKLIDSTDFSNNMINKSQLQHLMTSYFDKSDIWLHEKEWRIIAKIEIDELNDEMRFMDFPYVSKIVLGSKMSENHRKKIIEFARNNDIPIEEVVLDSKNYSFTYQRVEQE